MLLIVLTMIVTVSLAVMVNDVSGLIDQIVIWPIEVIVTVIMTVISIIIGFAEFVREVVREILRAREARRKEAEELPIKWSCPLPKGYPNLP